MAKLFNVQFDSNAAVETFPKKILEEQCGYLYEETEKIVIGRVAEYIGSIKVDPFQTSLFTGKKDAGFVDVYSKINRNIQDALGEMGDSQFTYEFFLTSKGTPDYKFRVFFMQYGITGYPVTIVLEEGIADEINHSDEDYTYHVQNRKEYEELLSRIFSSKRFGEILTKLMQLNS